MQHSEEFTLEHLKYAVEHISTPGATTPAQVGSWLTALRLTGIDRQPQTLAAYAEIARNKARPVDLPDRETFDERGDWVVDIVGTGGDGHDTFNVSTAASIVAAGAGARVCKVSSFSLISSMTELIRATARRQSFNEQKRFGRFPRTARHPDWRFTSSKLTSRLSLLVSLRRQLPSYLCHHGSYPKRNGLCLHLQFARSPHQSRQT